LTESVSEVKTIISALPSPTREKIADRKTIVYETLVDSAVMKLNGEKVKTEIFAKFLMKPARENIQFVSIDKYYEPFIIISGKYAIDYYRKSTYAIKVNKEVREVIVLNNQFKPEQSKDPKDPYAPTINVIKLDGEERIMKEFSASLILDQSNRNVPPERLPSAPSEREPDKILAESETEVISRDADLEYIKSRVMKRPKDISRIVSELIEVNERVVIYVPRFRLVYKNRMTGKERSVDFDGVTGKRIYTLTDAQRVQ